MGVMRTIGLIGGMSWHSTASYYRIINETVAHRRGGHASAPIALQSLDFATVRQHQIDGDWTAAGDLLREAARRVVAGGADVVAICTNLMHEVAPAVEGTVDVPLLHIADAVAASPAANGWDRLGVLGARRVMEDGFYTERLARHGISAITPAAADRELVDRVVFTELTRGQIRDDSRAAFVGVIEPGRSGRPGGGARLHRDRVAGRRRRRPAAVDRLHRRARPRAGRVRPREPLVGRECLGDESGQFAADGAASSARDRARPARRARSTR